MTVTVTMLAPTAYTAFQVSSGTTYTSDSTGRITGVAAGTDVRDLQNDGCTVISAGANVGTPGANVTAAEYGDGYRHLTILTFGALAVLPAIAGGAALGIGKLVYTLPAGAQMIKAARMAVGITQTAGHINADTPTVGLGTVIAAGVVSVLSGTATFQNIGVGKAAADCNGTPTVQTAKCTASPYELVTEVGGVKSIYFNAANTWAASGDPAAILSGTIAIDWAQMT